MLMSQLFGNTLRESPADAEMASHELALRAGLVRSLGAGLYSYLPLGYRVVRKIERILREEMEAIGAQEMLMPVLNPADLWKATGRWEGTGSALMKVRDRSGRDYALAMTHEEVVGELSRREIRSYRDLPKVVFHIQTRLRDEPRPRGGLIRVREFRMKDAYTLDVDAESLDRFYPTIIEAYRTIFRRCGVEAVMVEADTGMMGGADSHEFLMPHPGGEDDLIQCSSCEYAANAERAELQLLESRKTALEDTALVSTPGCATIAEVAAFVGVPTSQTYKAVFYAWERPEVKTDLVFVVIRGDLEVNETKLLNLLGGGELTAATDDMISGVGAEPGYASPIGLNVRSDVLGNGVLVVGDTSLVSGSNFVAGANQDGYHFTGVNYPRDFSVTIHADIARAMSGHSCPRCGEPLEALPAIELGHCFKLGTRYSEAMGVTYLDADGTEQLVVMGSYGIGVGRLIASIIETYHDENGIVWPPAVAPFDVHLVSLARSDEEMAIAEELYHLLQEFDLCVLWDDREERAGVKFADADLIGCPVRATVSRRSLEAGGVELKARWEDDTRVLKTDQVVNEIGVLLDRWPGL